MYRRFFLCLEHVRGIWTRFKIFGCEGVDVAQIHSLTQRGKWKNEKKHDLHNCIIRQRDDDQSVDFVRCTGRKLGIDL